MEWLAWRSDWLDLAEHVGIIADVWREAIH
jgi:hypothetical protein